MLRFTGERIVPEADNCEPQFARKMYQEHIARYLFAAQLCKGRQVLDVGCGVGYGSQILAREGAAHVTAFDLSVDAIAHARKFYTHPAVDFRVESASAFQLGRTFDVITCFELIEHVPAETQDEVLRLLAAHLSEDGVLFISTPRALERKRSEFHTREYTLEEFQSALQRHFGHTAFFFENNHFASLVTSDKPDSLRRIEVVGSTPFELKEADYFICLASRRPVDVTGLEFQLVLNDDQYVKLLEQDVDILHRAEASWREERALLEKRIAATEEQLASARTLEERNATFTLLEGRAERLQGRLEEVMQQRQTLYEKLGAMTQQLTAVRAEMEGWRQRAEAAESQVNSLLSSKSWRYAEPLRAGKRQLKKAVGRGRHQVSRVSEFLSRRVSRFIPDPAAPAEQVPAGPAPVQHVGPAFEADVLFVIGCHDGESKRYRVYNVSEALQGMGVSTRVMLDNQIPELLARGVRVRSLVLFRAAWTDELGKLIALARLSDARVFFDIDDLVFEPENIDNVRVVRDTFGPELRAQYLDGVKRYRRTLLECDAVTCPTDFLRQRAEALGKPGYVLPNTLNRKQLEIARGLPPKATTPGGMVRIGYFSGSNTHQVDFRNCEPALLRLMAAYPQVRFVLVGILELGPEWGRFVSRVDRVGFQPYEQMLQMLASMDVNLAPLEAGNPYCEAKSQLKIFEAGLVSVPTVASATSSYAASIEHGVDGLLARTEAEWFQALEALVKDAELRRSMGQKARARALSQFSLEALATVARDTFAPVREAEAPGAKKARPRTLKVSWVIPGLPLGSGGHRNILRVAYHLQRFGHDIELYFTMTEDSGAALAKSVKENFYPLDCPTQRYDGRFNATDVIFATHWSTVEVALRHRTAAQHLAYFVQDFEPLFYPMGSEYILAENTYRQGLYHITSGPWCAHLLREQFGVPAEHFVFPIDRDIYHPRAREDAGGPPRVLFFARPEMPRRCYDIGLRMLDALHKQMPEAEINLYGSRELAKQQYPFPARVHALLPGIQDLARLYGNSDVGVAFSTTNPSLVPYEMMACGLPVVDLHRPGNEINYGGRTDIALLADPIPERMARQVADLLRDPAERERRSKAGIELVSTFPNEEQMARRVEELLFKLYA